MSVDGLSERGGSTRRRPTVGRGSRRAEWLWAFAVGAVLADVATTQYGLGQGLTEGNPVVRVALARADLVGLWALKAGALGIGYLAWAALPSGQRSVVPLGLGVPWLAAAGLNAVTLFG